MPGLQFLGTAVGVGLKVGGLRSGRLEVGLGRRQERSRRLERLGQPDRRRRSRVEQYSLVSPAPGQVLLPSSRLATDVLVA